MREHDDVDLFFAFARFLLHHCVDRYRLIGENARDVGEDSGAIEHSQPQVVRGFHLLHGQDGQVRHPVWLKGEMRNPLLGIRRMHSGHVDKVCHDC